MEAFLDGRIRLIKLCGHVQTLERVKVLMRQRTLPSLLITDQKARRTASIHCRQPESLSQGRVVVLTILAFVVAIGLLVAVAGGVAFAAARFSGKGFCGSQLAWDLRC